MTDCETFEVELEMHAHGALDASRVAPLEAHLAQCESCRRYQALMRRSEQTMTAQTLDVNGLEARILELQDQRRSRSWLALAVPIALGAAIAALTGRPGIVFATLLPVALVSFGAIRLRLMLEQRGAARLARTRADYLAHYRRVLDARIRRIHVLTGVIPVFGAITLLQATVWNVWPEAMHRGAVYAVIGLGLALAYAFVLSLRFREVPALRKEREDLDPA